MRAYDLIAKKRDGQELSRPEIEFLIQGFTTGAIPDYQMSAWAMAVFLRGMNVRETADLTMAMVNSGERVDLRSIAGTKVDKHSTGGVGDKTTLVLAPLVAAAGVPFAKMSGRGLGHTGGTVDKFEAIPGFRVELSRDEFIHNVNTVKAAVAGQTANLVPADKKLYALRDVTATVESTPLIASSVMSKKIAAGADAIVLDVKCGNGAFMKTREQAFRLAQAMVEIGKAVGRKTVAVVTGMNQPLGYAIGNALEVKEAINTLAGRGPQDLLALSLILGSEMLVLAGADDDAAKARARLNRKINSGEALQKFKELILAQGGNPAVVDHPELLATAKYILPVLAERNGCVTSIDTKVLGQCATFLGAGRETKASKIDPAAGLVLVKKYGDKVSAGEPLAYVHVNDGGKVAEGLAQVKRAYAINSGGPEPGPFIYGRFD
ncbi:MAG TPA: pyrimidine-nucleoside phosphorylase [Desulfobacteria bacterium]|nr:pyrimidine-nucleoside phosphorylase [Desulfobacteria bacterium]